MFKFKPVKTVSVFISVFAITSLANAQRMSADGTYTGRIKSIAYGSYGEMGILLDNQRCNGLDVVYLKKR